MSYKKSRSRTQSAIYNYQVNSKCDWVGDSIRNIRSSVYNPGESKISKEETEQIVWDGNGRSYWHECSHTRVVRERIDPSHEWHYSTSFFKELWPGTTLRNMTYGATAIRRIADAPLDARFHDPGPDYRPDQADTSSILAMLDWSAARDAVMDDAAGLMPSDTSIGVNIAEFGQLKRMVPGITRSIKRILAYVRGNPNKTVTRYRYLFDKRTGKRIPWTGLPETVKLRSLSWSLRDLASLNLATSFGVLPLANDLGNWAGKLYQVQAHLNWYRLISTGKSVWLHARTNSVETVSDRRSRRYYSPQMMGYPTVDSEFFQNAQGILHMKVNITAKSQMALYNAILAQVLGLNVPIQLAWDLVPFSFVVDWFLPVGKLINRIEPKRALGSLAKSVSVEDVWYSYKVDTGFRAQYSGLERYSSDYETQLLDGGRINVSASTYSRVRGDPAYNLLPIGNIHYRGRQFLLTLSLLAQRLIRRR